MAYYTHTLQSFQEYKESKNLDDEAAVNEWRMYASNLLLNHGLSISLLADNELFTTLENGRLRVDFGKKSHYFDLTIFGILKIYNRDWQETYPPEVTDLTIYNLCTSPLKVGCTDKNGTFEVVSLSHKFASVFLRQYSTFLKEYISILNMLQDEILNTDVTDPEQNKQLMSKLTNANKLYFLPE